MKRSFIVIVLPVVLLQLAPQLARSDEADTAKQLDQAIATMEQRVERDPNDAAAFVVLGQLYIRKAAQGHDTSIYDLAEANLRKALALKPDLVAAQSQLAVVFQARHQFADAMKLSRQVLGQAPASKTAQAVLADALLELGEYDKAEKALEVLASDSAAPIIVARQANLAWLRGRGIEADELFRQALQDARDAEIKGRALSWYHLRLGSYLLATGNLDEANEQFDAALDAWPGSVDAMNGKAHVLAAQELPEEAVALLASSFSIAPRISTAVQRYEILLTLGDKPQAVQQFELIQKLCEQSIGRNEARREIAMFYADHGIHLDVAMQLARGDLSQRKDVHSYDTLAWVLYKRGLFEPAATTMELALREKTPDAMLHFHAGLIWHALGDKETALKHLERAIELNAHFSVLHAPAARQGVTILRQELGKTE